MFDWGQSEAERARGDLGRAAQLQSHIHLFGQNQVS